MNNIITRNGKEKKHGSGVYFRETDLKADFNCFFDNGPGPIGTHNYSSANKDILEVKPKDLENYPYVYKSHLGANEIQKDPKFISETDFHLKPSSPCIDRGSNKAPKLPRKDKDGKERIINKRVDIGAYEY